MRKWLITVAFGVGVFLVGGAFAAIPGADGRIHACYTKTSGDTRIVDEGAACKARENRITWSQTGPQGLKGDKGDKGDPGSPGLSGVETIVVRGEVQSSQFDVVTAYCPAGKRVVGGGASTQVLAGAYYDEVALFASYPPTDDRWQGVASEVNPTSGNWQLEVYAICANVAP